MSIQVLSVPAAKKLLPLPPEVWNSLEAHIGPLTGIQPCTEARNGEVAALLDTAAGRVFIKAMQTSNPRYWTHRREAAVNPHVLPYSPRLLGQVVTEGWDVNFFEALTGRTADYTPGSPDIPGMVELLTERTGIIAAPGVDLKHMPDRMAAYLNNPGDALYFVGDSLLHTNWLSTKVIMTPSGIRLVGWGWASRGAAWIDTAAWCLWLMAAGHSSIEAEGIASGVPAWRNADPRGITAFALATSRLWVEIAQSSPDPWARPITVAAVEWANHRTLGSQRP